LRGGLAAVGESSTARLLLALQTSSAVIVGALDILLVVQALRVLGKSSAWVGYLNTASGVGGLVLGLVATGLIAVRRMSVPLLAGGVAISIGLAAVAATTSAAASVMLLAV